MGKFSWPVSNESENEELYVCNCKGQPVENRSGEKKLARPGVGVAERKL